MENGVVSLNIFTFLYDVTALITVIETVPLFSNTSPLTTLVTNARACLVLCALCDYAPRCRHTIRDHAVVERQRSFFPFSTLHQIAIGCKLSYQIIHWRSLLSIFSPLIPLFLILGHIHILELMKLF